MTVYLVIDWHCGDRGHVLGVWAEIGEASAQRSACLAARWGPSDVTVEAREVW